MPVARFSRRAEADLLAISTYTVETWDINQAVRYLSELEACCQQLAMLHHWAASAMKSARDFSVLSMAATSFSIGRSAAAFRFRVFCTSVCCPSAIH